MKQTPIKRLQYYALHRQPVALLVGGAGVSALGFGLSLFLQANPVVETGMVFLIGLFIGGAIATLKRRKEKESP